MRSRLSLAGFFAPSLDYTPPLIITKHPDFHLQLPLRVPTLTCISFCIIPRLYPTAHHYKTSRLSLATVDRPPLLSVFIIKHHKSFNSARLSVAIMSYDSPLQDFHYSPSHRQFFARLPVAMVPHEYVSSLFSLMLWMQLDNVNWEENQNIYFTGRRWDLAETWQGNLYDRYLHHHQCRRRFTLTCLNGYIWHKPTSGNMMQLLWSLNIPAPFWYRWSYTRWGSLQLLGLKFLASCSSVTYYYY